jgi:fibronectin-binding autotransporter adhesin
MLVGKLQISKKSKLILAHRAYSLYAVLSLILFALSAAPARAQNVNGCDNYAPTTGQTVNCNSSYAASTSGVNTATNNTGNNNVTVIIGSTAQRSINGSTVGIGSASTVNNAGILNTQSFFNGYGISFGANGRSKAGGNSVTNSGTITTGGGNADAIHVESTNATSAADTIINSGTLSTSGSNANGIWTSSTRSPVTITNSGTISTSGSTSDAIYALNTGNVVSLTNSSGGKISATGTSSNGVSFFGAASITNAGIICAGTISAGVCQAPSSGGNAIRLSNTYNSTRSSITNQASGVISSPTTTAIQSLQPGVDISNYGTIYSPSTAVLFANTATSVSNSLTLYAGSTTTGTLAFNPNSSGETLTFSGLSNSSFNNTVTGLNTINAISGANVTMSSPSGYTFVNGSMNVDGASALTISGAITDGTGISSITKTGAGTLTLSGANTYTGVTNVNAGTLAAGAANSFSSSSAHTIASGATLSLNNFAQTIGSLAGAGTTSLGSATLTAGGNNTSTSYAGSMTGAGGLTKVGSGTMTVSALQYTGATNVNAGTLKAAGANAFASSSAHTIASGATLSLNNFDQTIGSLAGSSTSASVQLGSGTLTTNGDGSSTTFEGTISGSGGLTKEGSGYLILGYANNYTGTTNINAGELGAGANGTFSQSSLTNINSGGTLNLYAFTQDINNINLAGGTLKNGILNGAVTSTGGSVNAITGSASLTNTSGTTTLTGANGYTGTTTVNGGTVKGGGVNAFSATSATTINSNGVVDLGGFSQSINAVSLAGGTLTSGALIGAITSTGGTVNSITGSASLTSTSGATTLTGVNGYSGLTSVNGGIVTNNGSMTSATTVASGATYNNNGTAVGTVTNACGGTVNNAGLIGNNVTNAGLLTNSGSITGTLTNNTPCGVINNTSSISGTVINNATLNNNAGSTISGTVTNNSSSIFTNSGLITNAVSNSGAFSNAGTISGAVTNNASSTFNNYGNINNTVANAGIFNLDGTPTVTGAISGSGTVNVNGLFTQQATIAASELNINNGGTLYMADAINATTAATISSGGTLSPTSSQTITGILNNNGTVAPTSSGVVLTVTGDYAQSSGANFISKIDGLSSGSYSQITSNSQVNIASGAVITAQLNPTLKLNPGDVISAVIQGNVATATPASGLTVNTISDRYTLLYKSTNQKVDLYLPDNGPSGVLQAYKAPGTYYGALQEQTLSSIAAIQVPTLGVLHQRYALLNAVVEYDCNKFDKHNFCISAQARATGFGTQATGAGVLNIAYRPIPQVHIGAFIDYQAAAGNPAVNGTPIAVTLASGGVQYGYDNPTFGGYAGFSQSGYSGNLVNTGLQIMVSGAYNPGKVSVSRALIMNPYLPFVDSQPGTGNASLNSSVIRGMVGYGIPLTDRATLMPYGGIRFTDVTRGGYMESFNALVTQPLVYNSFYERLLTGFGGAMLNGRLTDRFGTIIGLGLETDLTRYANSFSGYSPLAIEYMTNFGFDHGGSWNGLRPTANAGAYYDVAPNQRISLNGFAGQQAWTSRTYATGLLGYQIAF